MRHHLLLAAVPLLATAATPPGTAAISLTSDSETRWVPFTLTPGNQIRFALSINGQPAVAVLDTGVTATVVSRRFATAARLKVSARGQASAIGGAVAIGWAPTRSIAFGGLMRQGGGVTVTTLPANATGDAEPVDILVGQDLINAFAVDIDYEDMRFRLLKSGRLPFRGNAAPLSIARDRNVYVSAVTINGKTLAPMVVDTGDGSSITFSQEAFRASRMPPMPMTTTIAYGIAGPIVTDLAIVPELQIGRLAVPETEIRVERRGGFSQSIGMAGRIGSGFLQHYRVLLDPGAGHMVLGPTSMSYTPPVRSTSGLLVASGAGRLEVLHVMRGSPAEAAGWRGGETICAVDGQPIPALYHGTAASSWAVGQPGRIVTLSLCNGGSRQLKLQRFY